eukprot:2921638-Prymnesium_polylepis.1
MYGDGCESAHTRPRSRRPPRANATRERRARSAAATRRHWAQHRLRLIARARHPPPPLPPRSAQTTSRRCARRRAARRTSRARRCAGGCQGVRMKMGSLSYSPASTRTPGHTWSHLVTPGHVAALLLTPPPLLALLSPPRGAWVPDLGLALRARPG